MHLRVDFRSGKPAHLQLIEQLKGAASSGALRAGEFLPQIGALAGELRISRNSVARAYSELESLGLIELLPGKGYCLKEQHRPLRKEVSRIDAPQPAQERRRRFSRKQFLDALPAVGASILYLLAAMGIAALAVSAAGIRRPSLVILVTAAAAALLLPLVEPLRRGLLRLFFPKRFVIPVVLQSMKAKLWSAGNLDEAIQLAIDVIDSALGARAVLVRDRREVLEVVNAHPALRSSRAPLTAGNDILMPLFSHEEVLAVLRFRGLASDRDRDDNRELLAGIAELVADSAVRFKSHNERRDADNGFEIQRGLLPRDIPQAPGFSLAGAWQPAKTVGGDYYDVLPLGEHELALIVADVAGKGMPAALLMANLQATVKAYATTTTSPKQLCERVNRAICSSISAGRFITFFFAVLDTSTRRLAYCNAGHNAPLIVSGSGTRRKLDVGGPVLGIFPSAPYEQATLELSAGDRLLIYTDGVLEAANAVEEEFGEDRLLAIMNADTSSTAARLRDSVMQSVTQFCRGDFADDATLLSVVVEEDADAAAKDAPAAAALGAAAR